MHRLPSRGSRPIGNTKPAAMWKACSKERAREWLSHLVELQESGSSEEFSWRA